MPLTHHILLMDPLLGALVGLLKYSRLPSQSQQTSHQRSIIWLISDSTLTIDRMTSYWPVHMILTMNFWQVALPYIHKHRSKDGFAFWWTRILFIIFPSLWKVAHVKFPDKRISCSKLATSIMESFPQSHLSSPFQHRNHHHHSPVGRVGLWWWWLCWW